MTSQKALNPLRANHLEMNRVCTWCKIWEIAFSSNYIDHFYQSSLSRRISCDIETCYPSYPLLFFCMSQKLSLFVCKIARKFIAQAIIKGSRGNIEVMNGLRGGFFFIPECSDCLLYLSFFSMLSELARCDIGDGRGNLLMIPQMNLCKIRTCARSPPGYLPQMKVDARESIE